MRFTPASSKRWGSRPKPASPGARQRHPRRWPRQAAAAEAWASAELALILRWVNHVDLFRIKGVEAQYAELLEASGVDSVPELAQRNASHLYAKLVEVNAKRPLVGRLPSEGQVADWVEEAKTLPRVVTH